MDSVCMSLYKRQFPKVSRLLAMRRADPDNLQWSEEFKPTKLVADLSTVTNGDAEEMDME